MKENGWIWERTDPIKFPWLFLGRLRPVIASLQASDQNQPSKRPPTADELGGGAEALGMPVASEPSCCWDASSRVSSRTPSAYNLVRHPRHPRLASTPVDRQQSLVRERAQSVARAILHRRRRRYHCHRPRTGRSGDAHVSDPRRSRDRFQ